MLLTFGHGTASAGQMTGHEHPARRATQFHDNLIVSA
jgi:hypothetical protein